MLTTMAASAPKALWRGPRLPATGTVVQFGFVTMPPFHPRLRALHSEEAEVGRVELGHEERGRPASILNAEALLKTREP